MPTSGMIGGLGPESTVDYYRSIIARYRARKPDGGYPHIILNSLDVDKGIALLDAERLGDLAGYLADAVESLVCGGIPAGRDGPGYTPRVRAGIHSQEVH
jgi:aspartate racemase